MEIPSSLPPARIVPVPGRGEIFLRDSGGDGPPVLLLHGWMFSADLNWFRTYGPLEDAGYRVLAVDHRGHGRGMRTHEDFRLHDCADDAAALLREVGIERAVVVGYSMGGPIAALLAQRHPSLVSGLVLGATAAEWQDPRMKAFWNLMAGLRLVLGAAPDSIWRAFFRASGFPQGALTDWMTAELTRGSAKMIAEAGRELGRFDGRPWLGELDVPAAVIVTAADTAVPPDKQRALAELLGAAAFEVDGDHSAVTARARRFNVELLRALEAVAAARDQGARAA